MPGTALNSRGVMNRKRHNSWSHATQEISAETDTNQIITQKDGEIYNSE